MCKKFKIRQNIKEFASDKTEMDFKTNKRKYEMTYIVNEQGEIGVLRQADKPMNMPVDVSYDH